MVNNKGLRHVRGASFNNLFYLLFIILPIYWLVITSLKSNQEILAGFSLLPAKITFDNYLKIFTDSTWYMGYINSLTYTLISTFIVILVSVPAAYGFSRYRFIGDKHLFFWLLTNRMTPPAVFVLPFFQLYSSLNLFDTHIAVALAHCLLNIPMAIWILEGFMSGIPIEIDETSKIDGHGSFYYFFSTFIPLSAPGISVAAFFSFMFSWIELLLARTLTSVNAKPIVVTMTRTVSASGLDWGVLTAAGVLTMIPGIIAIYFVRNYIAKGFAMGRI